VICKALALANIASNNANRDHTITSLQASGFLNSSAGGRCLGPQRRFDMPVTAQYVFIVTMDVAPEKEALFNEIYDREHVPYLLKVPGVRSATRLRIEPATVNIGGETKQLTGEGSPRYMAIYEIDNPDVLISATWAEAGEQGRWPAEVRPYTSNRHHAVRKVL
jgi:hypothetical protein